MSLSGDVKEFSTLGSAPSPGGAGMQRRGKTRRCRSTTFHPPKYDSCGLDRQPPSEVGKNFSKVDGEEYRFGVEAERQITP